MAEKMNSQARIIEIVKLLGQNHIAGMTNKEISLAVQTTETNACRDMKLLADAGWLCKDSKSRWRLSPEFGGLAGQIIKSYQRARLQLSEEEAKYASTMQ